MDRPEDPNRMGGTETSHHRNGHSNHFGGGPLTPPPFRERIAEEVLSAEVISPQEMACRFGKAAAGIYTASVVGASMAGMDDAETMMHYLRTLTSESNTDADPLQRMLMEQITIAFHRIAALHVSSAHAKTPEGAIAFNGAATRLLGELRMSMLALKQMQQIPMCGATFIKVARTQTPPVVEVQSKPATELGSKEKSNGIAEPGPRSRKESKTSDRRPPESPKKSGDNGRGVPKAAYSDPDPPALGAVNGTAHNRW